jgi:hypothetical protein
VPLSCFHAPSIRSRFMSKLSHASGKLSVR